MRNEQRIRFVLFYLSVTIFLAGLPFILSFSLGYKFDRRTFKFTKTGLLIIKTQPAGADIFLDKKLLGEKTPYTVNELLPGTYELKLELERYYPWTAQVQIEANKLTRFEKIIFFPLRPHIKQLNKDRLSSYWVDEKTKLIYYVNPADNNIYQSNLEGEYYKRVGSFIDIQPPPLKWLLSPDAAKLLYYNNHQIVISYLKPYKEPLSHEPIFIQEYAGNRITDAFWHSDSYHIIVAGDKSIEVWEARPNATPVILSTLNKKGSVAFYDTDTDTLYFSDYEKAADGKFYNNLYRLQLNNRGFALPELMKSKNNE
jgi:hypothetical protein